MRAKLLIILLAVTAAAAMAGLYQLFMLRFEAGDLFPPGSSLRSDPLGSMALYQALERTAGLSVQRNYRSLDQQQIVASTILLLGSDHRRLLTVTKQQTTTLERLAAAGNRVILAFSPAAAATQRTADHGEKPRQPAGPWGVTPHVAPAEPGQPATSPLRAALQAPETGLPPQVALRSHLTLIPAADSWRVIYTVQDRPVLLERTIGSGSMVLVADSSLFSNQSLKEGRQTTLLAWLLGGHPTVIFDEAHLGVTEQGGIMALIRRFDLLPLLGVLLVLAGLYLWRASVPLAPSLPPDAEGQTIGVAHDSFSGLVNLLRRSIPAGQLLPVCCQEWQRSFGTELKEDEQLRRTFQEALKQGDEPLQGYRRIARLRAERKRR